MQERSVVIPDGLTTFAYDAGAGDPVVLLHGMVATADCWRYTIDALQARYHLIVPDLPGHGRSPAPHKPYGLAFYTCWLDGFLNALKLPEVTLIGHSMGGAISLAYVAQRPGRVARLGLVDALGLGLNKPYGSLLRAGRRLPHLLMAWVTGKTDPHLLRFLQPWSLLDPWGAPRALVEKMDALNGPHEAQVVWAGLRLLVGDFWFKRQRQAFLARQREIAIPTLIVWGRQDGLLPLEHAYEGAANIPGARLAIIDNCAHEPMMEVPETFNAILGEFLESA